MPRRADRAPNARRSWEDGTVTLGLVATEEPVTPMSAMGQSRRISAANGFAGCPLYLQ